MKYVKQTVPLLVAQAMVLGLIPATALLTTFKLEAVAISSIDRAFDTDALTSQELVYSYLNCIEIYYKAGETPLSSIVLMNPNVLGTAKALDLERELYKPRSPLHGIPTIVKDNYDTFDLPTTAGSLAFAASVPPDDAFQVQRSCEAGAIVLAKSNMAKFAFSAQCIISSILGTTRNPYDLSRVPARSSCGTGADVAANFGAVRLGTGTGNSIRSSSSHNALVGIPSTIGLTSRDGIVPLNFNRDIGGAMV